MPDLMNQLTTFFTRRKGDIQSCPLQDCVEAATFKIALASA